jgi:hypothetical protein
MFRASLLPQSRPRLISAVDVLNPSIMIVKSFQEWSQDEKKVLEF